MRRGLLSWSQDEVPAGVLEGLAAELGAAAKAQGLDAVLLFGDSGRPAALSRVTQLVANWSSYFLLITKDGKAELIIGSGGQRGIPWIQQNSRTDGIYPAADFGIGIAERARELAGAAPRIGVIDLPVFPAGPLDSLRAACPGVELVDASALFDRVRPVDDAALVLLGTRAAEIAEAGIAAGLGASAGGGANAVVAAADRAARLAGAEEVLIALAPDAAADPRLRRIEDDVAVADLFCLQLSVAYKGQWVRVGRTLARVGASADWLSPLESWFRNVLRDPALSAGPAAALAKSPPSGAAVEFWRLEGAAGTLPLTLLMGSEHPALARPVRGTPSLSLRLRTPHGVFFAAGAVPRPAGSGAT